MKYYLITFFLLVASNGFAQDTLFKKNGDTLLTKIIEINPETIKYQNYGFPDGPLYVILKSDVNSVHFENGVKEIFNTSQLPLIKPERDMYAKGFMDAQRYYTRYRPAGTVTVISSVISPLVGLVPAIIFSATPPLDKNLDYPNDQLIKNREYYLGYRKKASKMKSGKVWLNWGIGLGVNVIAYVLFVEK